MNSLLSEGRWMYRIWKWQRKCLLHQTCLSRSSGSASQNDPPYYITTPIFYVNAAPHIGHLYTALVADVCARWQRLKGRRVLFSTGTDEHGLKIQQAAERNNMSPKDYCDQLSSQFRSLFDQTGISYDHFIRTTQPKHYEAVHKFWELLSQRGFIYKGSYEGWYCVSDEAFLTEEEVKDETLTNGMQRKVSMSSGHPVTWTKEDNYMFRLTAFREQLTAWINTGAIQPRHFESLVQSWTQDLRDLSVSRQRQRLSWGIPVPGDDSQTVYVWLDALVNYLTVVGFPDHPLPASWPPTCQVIGKDILRFHAIYWPAFLFAAGMQPPQSLLCHSHWLVEGQKMSKSLGNVVDPVDRMNKFSVDGLRYFLIREGSIDSDGSYSDSRAVERINTELVNSIGNLLSRTTAPSVNKPQEFPALDCRSDLATFLSPDDARMFSSLYSLPEQVDDLYESFSFPRVLDLLLVHVYWANAVVQSHEPWTLVKSQDPASQKHLRVVLHVALETLRVCGILLQPIVPDLSDRLLKRLGVSAEERGIENIGSSVKSVEHSAHLLGNRATLLNRIQAQKQ